MKKTPFYMLGCERLNSACLCIFGLRIVEYIHCFVLDEKKSRFFLKKIL